MSGSPLYFSRKGNLNAIIASIALILPCAAAIYYSVRFEPPYDTGSSRGALFREANYETHGWFAIIVFSVFILTILPLLWRALARLFTKMPAVEFGGNGLLVHSSFLTSDHAIPYSAIRSVSMTTEGEAMSAPARVFSGAVTPLGSGWAVRHAEKKICVLIGYVDANSRQKSLKISAQFIEGGRITLAEFVPALKRLIQKRD